MSNSMKGLIILGVAFGAGWYLRPKLSKKRG